MRSHQSWLGGIAVIVLLWLTGPASAAGPASAPDTDPAVVMVNRIFSVQIKGATNCDSVRQNEQINLLINGIDTGMHAIGCDPATGKLTFTLKRGPVTQHTPASNAAWEAMLGRPWDSSQTGYIRPLRFTIVQALDNTIESLGSGTLNLRILNPVMACSGAILVLMVWTALIVLGNKSGLIKDTGKPGIKPTDRPFSLSRVQLAWWFAIIVGAYVFLWVVTGDMPVLSTQALALMGISSVTGLAAVGVENSKQTGCPVTTGNFFLDLLTDASGVTLHRFQMLAMTVILGVVFLFYVGARLAMPEFDGSTLTLLGISAGTYVGFKLPEKSAATPCDDAAADGQTAANGDPKLGYSATPEKPD